LKIVHTEASLGYGGQELRIINEARGLQARGHEVTLICPAEAQINALAATAGLPVVTLPIGLRRPAALLALRRWIREHAPDVINTHSSTDSWLVALATRGLQPRPAIVRTRHISAPVPHGYTSRWLYTRGCDHVVTTGEQLRETLIADNGFPAVRISSVRTGIDLARFTPGDRLTARRRLDLPVDGLIIGIVATLRSWKGHRHLVNAFAGLRRGDARLLIVGDGPQWEALHEQVSRDGLRQRVIFAGRQQAVETWLQAMDVFCLPSYANEGVPQSLMQAQACGLPCVTTMVGSMAEAVVPGRTALVVGPEDVLALRVALQQLCDDDSLRQRLGTAARRYAEEEFAVERMLDAMEGLFRQVVAQRGAGR